MVITHYGSGNRVLLCTLHMAPTSPYAKMSFLFSLCTGPSPEIWANSNSILCVIHAPFKSCMNVSCNLHKIFGYEKDLRVETSATYCSPEIIVTTCSNRSVKNSRFLHLGSNISTCDKDVIHCNVCVWAHQHRLLSCVGETFLRVHNLNTTLD